MRQKLLTTFVAALFGLPAAISAQQPEIGRGAATPQSDGSVHTLRTITEACTRLEGVFTGKAERPYAVRTVRSAPGCQPRARFDAKAVTGGDTGWVLNDRITVPSASCAGQSAVVEVWRLPGTAAPPKLDAQGRSRIYFEEGQQSKQPDTATLQRYATTLEVTGTCRAR